MKRTTLRKCVSEILKNHRQLTRFDAMGLERAIAIGRWLDEAHQLVRAENRNWTEFIESKFRGNPSYDTCQRYRDLYQYSAELRSNDIKLLTEAYDFVQSKKQACKLKRTTSPVPAPAPLRIPSPTTGEVDPSKIKLGNGIKLRDINPKYHGEILTALGGHPDPANVKPTLYRDAPAPELKSPTIQPVSIGAASLYCCDMLTAPVEDNSLHAVICDPPYGKDALGVWNKLAVFSAAKLKPGGVLLAMAGTYHLPSFFEQLRCDGLLYYWTLCYEMEKGSDCDWSGNGRSVHAHWKPVLVYVKGGYKGKYLKSDMYADQLSTKQLGKSYHRWGQSLPYFQYLVEHFTEENHLVCDPCVGGGTTAIASVALKRRFVGIDIDPKTIETTSNRIRDWHTESVSTELDAPKQEVVPTHPQQLGSVTEEVLTE